MPYDYAFSSFSRLPIPWPAKTNPGYSLKPTLCATSQNRYLFTFSYQDHNRDFFTVIQDPIAGLPSTPYLQAANGYTAYASFQLPVSKPSEVLFWAGPKLGLKEVTHFSSSSKLSGSNKMVAIDQLNRYYLAQLTLRNYIGRFILEAYLHAGLVNIQWEATFYHPDGRVDYVDDDWSNYWPHGLLGFSVGYEF